MKQSVEGPPSDETLVERARRGDVDAYEKLVVRYQGIAYRTAYLTLGRAEGVDDVAQTAFIKAYYALHRFRQGASFRPWLLKIVVNEARNAARTVGRHGGHHQQLDEGRPLADASPSPEAAAFAAEQRQTLLDAIADLRPDDRAVIAYRYFLDLSEGEMAEILGCPRGTVKSRLSRALGRLKERLGTDVVGSGDGE